MRRVQEYLREVDTEKLINYYLYSHPIEWEDISNSLMTVKKVRESIRVKLQQFIKKLQELEIENSPNGKEYILFAHREIKDIPETVFSLACIQELREYKENAESYGFFSVKHSVVMGFWVAETKLTQNNIYGLLADVIYTASFFGFEQENLREIEEKLKESETAVRKAAERGERVGRDAALVFKRLRKRWGMEEEEVDEEEEALKKKVWDAQINYYIHCRKAEIKKVITLLEEKGKFIEVLENSCRS